MCESIQNHKSNKASFKIDAENAILTLVCKSECSGRNNRYMQKLENSSVNREKKHF